MRRRKMFKSMNIPRTLARVSPLIIILLLLMSACSSNETSGEPNHSEKSTDKNGTSEVSEADDLDHAKVTYEREVKEIIAGNCLACHGNDSPTMTEFNEEPEKYKEMMKGPRLSDYENLLVVVNGSEAGALMRRLDNGENKDDGEPGNMYEHLGETEEKREENLSVIKEWVGHWTLKRENEFTDEDYEKFKVLEQ